MRLGGVIRGGKKGTNTPAIYNTRTCYRPYMHELGPSAYDLNAVGLVFARGNLLSRPNQVSPKPTWISVVLPARTGVTRYFIF